MTERPRWFVWVRNLSPMWEKWNFFSPQIWADPDMTSDLRPIPHAKCGYLQDDQIGLSWNVLAKLFPPPGGLKP